MGGVPVQAGGFKVDHQALHGIGGNVGQAASTLRETVMTANRGLAPAPQPGSAAGAAAQAAGQLWLAELQRLTAQLDQYGEGLLTTARKYEAADKASADGVRRSGAGAK